MTETGNKVQTIQAAGGEFMIEQRNAGFADNDGRWIVSQLPELYWSKIGTLRRKRAGRFLGVCDDLAAVAWLIANTEPMPEVDEMVTSMGRVSC